MPRLELDVSLLHMSRSLPSLGSEPAAFARAAASSSPGSPVAKSVGGASSKSGRHPSGKRNKLHEFTQNQYYSAPFDQAYEELARARNLRKLEALFYGADADGSGEMSLCEFREALRQPAIQRAFAVLGVQPHQSTLVFKSIALRNGKGIDEELSITEFMSGLNALMRESGPGKELDIETLRPAYRSKIKNLSVCEKNMLNGIEVEKLAKSTRAVSAPDPSSLIINREKPKSHLDLGPVHLLPKMKVQRAFVHSASAQALHSATSSKTPLKLIFPF
jgi:hypothetical protein